MYDRILVAIDPTPPEENWSALQQTEQIGKFDRGPFPGARRAGGMSFPRASAQVRVLATPCAPHSNDIQSTEDHVVSCEDDVEPGRALKILRALRKAAPWGRAIACVALIFQAIAVEAHPVIASSRED